MINYFADRTLFGTGFDITSKIFLNSITLMIYLHLWPETIFQINFKMGAWNLIPVSARIYLLILSYFLKMEEICQFSGKRVNDLARRLLKFYP